MPPQELVLPVAALVAAALAVVALLAAAVRLKGRRGARVAEELRVSEQAVRPLVHDLLDDEDPDPEAFDTVKGRDGDALERVITELIPRLRGEDQAALRRVLVRRGVIDHARRRTTSISPRVRAGAAATLGTTADRRVLPELTVLLGDADAAVRSAAARALGRLGNPGAVPFLLAGLGHQRVPAGDVVVAIDQIGPRAVPGLRAGLALPTAKARALAADLLGRMSAVEAVDDLISLVLDDPDPLVVAAAARALGRIGHPRAIAALRAATEAPRPEAVRGSATWALAQLNAGDLSPMPAEPAAVTDEKRKLHLIGVHVS